MLNSLPERPPDKIIKLIQEFKDDPRPHKVDLGVGVYRDLSGITPIMRAVKLAEKRLWETESTKTYTGMAGEPAFRDAMARLVLGSTIPLDRIASVTAPGGTGAIHQGLELVREVTPGATVWVSEPSWPNHRSMATHLGFPVRAYRYFDSRNRTVNFNQICEDLSEVKRGDVVIVHGCCHNPTGADMNLQQWGQLGDLLLSKGALPLVDIAYQGFGNGLSEDASAARMFASGMPELLVAASCSKNFGIYRERTGVLMVVSETPALANSVQGSLTHLNRQNFSFPPDHGARLVTMVLEDGELRSDWETELAEIRDNLRMLRNELAHELRRISGSDRFGFVAGHHGMFSLLGASQEQVDAIRDEHAIYMVGDGRVNIAGLNRKTIPVLAKALISAGV